MPAIIQGTLSLDQSLVSIGLVFDMGGAIFIAWSIIGSESRHLAMTATHTLRGYNPHLLRSLADEKAYAKIGLALLLLGFGMQLVGTTWSRAETIHWTRASTLGLAVCVGLLFILVTRRFFHMLANNIYTNALSVLIKNMLENKGERLKVASTRYASLDDFVEDLKIMSNDQDQEELFKEVCKRVGFDPPAKE